MTWSDRLLLQLLEHGIDEELRFRPPFLGLFARLVKDLLCILSGPLQGDA